MPPKFTRHQSYDILSVLRACDTTKLIHLEQVDEKQQNTMDERHMEEQQNLDNKEQPNIEVYKKIQEVQTNKDPKRTKKPPVCLMISLDDIDLFCMDERKYS